MLVPGAKQLKELRDAEGTSQEQLAVDCDVRQATISNIETGKHRPSSDLREAFMERYGIELDAWRTPEERKRLEHQAALRDAAASGRGGGEGVSPSADR